MEVPEIMREFEQLRAYFPRDAVVAAIEKREEITPVLLEVLADPQRMLRRLENEPRYFAPIYAMFLLAQFRDRRAYPLIVAFFSIPGDGPIEATGDFVTEDLGRILASVCGGDVAPIKGMIVNGELNEYVRDAGFAALETLVAAGLTTRDEVLAYYQTLFRGRLEREPAYVWSGLAVSATRLYPEGLMDDIEQAYKDDLVDSWTMGPEQPREQLAKGKDETLRRLRSDPHHKLVDDAVQEMHWWACFKPEPAPPPARPQPAPVVPAMSATPPAKRVKIGRNDPCPCGSGKKYKRCCGR